MKQENISTEFESGEFLWRYLDIHKFIRFISSKSLTFSRLDLSKDSFEGYDIGGLKITRLFHGILSNPNNFQSENNDDHNLLTKQYQMISKATMKNYTHVRQTHFINCWFSGIRESMAMWDIYSNEDSVLVRARPKELIELVNNSVLKYSQLMEIISERVKYDYIMPMDSFRIKNIDYTPGLVKDIAYSHENEFRFIIKTEVCNENFKIIDIPLKQFNEIECFDVICHPKMSSWKIENIKELLRAFGINWKVWLSEVKLKK